MNVPSVSTSPLHLLGKFAEAHGGTELELLEIRDLLEGRRRVSLWSEAIPHRAFAGLGIKPVDALKQLYPVDGTLLVVGIHLKLGPWLRHTQFEKIIVLLNLFQYELLFAMVTDIRDATGLNPELEFVTRQLQSSVGLSGRVKPSLLRLDPFLKIAEERFKGAVFPCTHARPFTVGRASRDFIGKHHPDDAALYRMFASVGIRVRIMGGTCLHRELESVPGIELLPAGSEPIDAFYASLDCFFYRTGELPEAYGRVVLEAMATGLPVVTHSRGGYTEAIESGVSGIIIHTQEEAYDAVVALRESADLALRLGQSAVKKAMQIHGAAATERYLQAYL